MFFFWKKLHSLLNLFSVDKWFKRMHTSTRSRLPRSRACRPCPWRIQSPSAAARREDLQEQCIPRDQIAAHSFSYWNTPRKKLINSSCKTAMRSNNAEKVLVEGNWMSVHGFFLFVEMDFSVLILGKKANLLG